MEHDMDSLKLRLQYEEDQLEAHAMSCSRIVALCPRCSYYFGLEEGDHHG